MVNKFKNVRNIVAKLANVKINRYIRNILKTKKGEVSHLQY